MPELRKCAECGALDSLGDPEWELVTLTVGKPGCQVTLTEWLCWPCAREVVKTIRMKLAPEDGHAAK